MTKGDPYFRRLRGRSSTGPCPSSRRPAGARPVGCIHVHRRRQDPEDHRSRARATTTSPTLAESALRNLKDKRNATPDEVPTHLLKRLTSKMDMFQLHRQVVLALLVITRSSRRRRSLGPRRRAGVVIDVNAPEEAATTRSRCRPRVDGDRAVAREVAQVAGVRSRRSPACSRCSTRRRSSPISRPRASGIEPQKWKDVGALGVIKYKATADATSSSGSTRSARAPTRRSTKTYKRAGTTTRAARPPWCNEVVKYYTGEPGFFGSKIAFTAKGKRSSAIYAMDFDGANAYAVSNNSSTNMLPAWSPSGGQIAYTSFMRNNPDLYVGPAGGGRPKKLVGAPRHEHRRVVVARRQQDRADAVEGRQPRDLRDQRERRRGRSRG